MTHHHQLSNIKCLTNSVDVLVGLAHYLRSSGSRSVISSENRYGGLLTRVEMESLRLKRTSGS